MQEENMLNMNILLLKISFVTKNNKNFNVQVYEFFLLYNNGQKHIQAVS